MGPSDIQVEVILVLPSRQFRKRMAVPMGTTAREAVARALELGLIPATVVIDVDPMSAPVGVYGEAVDDNTVLQSGDRVEIYRPLQQDPKDLRRRRAKNDAR